MLTPGATYRLLFRLNGKWWQNVEKLAAGIIEKNEERVEAECQDLKVIQK